MYKMADEGRGRGKLQQLDLKRGCSASAAKDACWLCDELENWNSILNDLHLSLVEFQPGKLRICVETSKPADDVADENVPCDTSGFTAWLIRKHGCIQSVSIKQGDPHWQVAGLSDSVGSVSSNLRDISIEGNGPLDWALVLDSLGHIAQLESLKLTDVVVNDKLQSKLVELLTANACFVRTFILTRTRMWGNVCDGLVRSISRCNNLSELVLDVKLIVPGTTTPANRRGIWERHETPDSSDEDSPEGDFRYGYAYSTEKDSTDWSSILASFQESLARKDYDFNSQSEDMHLNLKARNDVMLCELSNFLESSVSLTSLSFNAFHRDHVESIAHSLLTNSVLRDLVISYKGPSYQLPTRSCVGSVLQSLLSHNKGLRSLTIENCMISRQGGREIFKGLQANSTLERLRVNTRIEFPVAWALCCALVKNKTLRTLCLGESISATDSQRLQLSRDMAKFGLFGRIQMDWKNWDMECLARYVLTPARSPTDLRLQMSSLSDANLSILCQALSASLCVESLTAHLPDTTTPERVAILREALERNESLKCVTLHDSDSTPHSAMEAAQGLSSNRCVTELAVHSPGWVDTKCATLLASLLVSNEALRRVVISHCYPMTKQCADVVYEGLLQNCVITEWHVSHSTPPMERAVQRNLSRLQRAVRFVLQPNTVKLCAETFELLEAKASLISGLISASAMSKVEAESAVKAARMFIQDNYLFINQIVCHGVECYAGAGTQIDRLNLDCWRAITKYLKVSDVISGSL